MYTDFYNTQMYTSDGSGTIISISFAFNKNTGLINIFLNGKQEPYIYNKTNYYMSFNYYPNNGNTMTTNYTYYIW